MAVTAIRDRKTKKIKGYRAEVYVSGVRIADRYFDAKIYTRSSAIAWHEETKAAGSKGYRVLKTVGDVVLQYQQGPGQKLAQTTRERKGYVVAYVTEAPIAKVHLSDLSPHHISAWLEWLRERATNPQRFSFRNELVFLGRVLRWYKENYNPALVVPILKSHKTDGIKFKPKKPRRPDYYIQPQDIHRWLEAMSSKKDRAYHDLAKLMIYTGLRVGEAAALCWDAVDLDKKHPSIRVMRTITWDRSEKVDWQESAKTRESIRYLRIPQVLIELLTSLKHKGTHQITCSDGEIRSPVFFNKRGQELKYSSIKRSFNKAFRASGLEWTGTHIARHTLATLTLKATKENASVQALLGHTTAAQTQKYAKVIALEFGDGLERAADLIANHALDHA